MLPVPESIAPMEAKPVQELPTGAGWQYEPKWDGFRCLVFRDGKTLDLRSKRQTLLNRYFPELVAGLAALKPRRFVLDGEILVMIEGKPNFESLQLRLHPAESRVRKLASEIPSLFMAFDMLVDAKGRDIRKSPLEQRRTALTGFHAALGEPDSIVLSPATSARSDAQKWLEHLGKGMDGIVAKRIDEPYQAGQRAMVKYKVWKTIDCVVAGLYLDAKGAVEYLLLGLYDSDGLLNYVGRCKPPGSQREILKKLKPVRGGTGFTGNAPAGVNRWSGKQREAVKLKPRLVAEVSADHVSGGRMRHGSRFLRWRSDKAPKACSTDQMAPGGRVRTRQGS
jgi:ATP-dependent DNA ligase